jgi:hypothetical protein
MTKLDLVLDRIKKLPPERQDAMVDEIDFMLDDEEKYASVLTDAQWAQVRAAIANAAEPVSAHEEVFARLEAEDE